MNSEIQDDKIKKKGNSIMFSKDMRNLLVGFLLATVAFFSTGAIQSEKGTPGKYQVAIAKSQPNVSVVAITDTTTGVTTVHSVKIDDTVRFRGCTAILEP
jgi:hypothetical protein